MAFSIFFVLTWFIVFIFGVMPKRLSIVENTFVFLITLVTSINFSWIVMNEFEWIKLTEETLPYIASLLNRSIIIPVLLLIQLNMSMARDAFLWKVIVIVSVVLLLVGMSYLMTVLNITDNTDWNHGFDAIYFLVLNLIAYVAYWLIDSVSEKAVNQL